MKGLVFGPSAPPTPAPESELRWGALLGATCKERSALAQELRAGRGPESLSSLRSRAATNWGAPGSPRTKREQTRQPFVEISLSFYFFKVLKRRLKLVALFSCLYSNDGYFCIQCEYPYQPLIGWPAVRPPGPLSTVHLQDSCVRTQDSPIPVPAPKTDYPVNLVSTSPLLPPSRHRALN